MVLVSEARVSLKAKLSLLMKSMAIGQNYNLPEPATDRGKFDTFVQEVLKHKSKWLSEGDLYGVIVDCLLARLGAMDLKGQSGRLLCDFLSSEVLELVEKEIIDFIETIPRSYSLYVNLQNNPGIVINSYSISEEISFERIVAQSPMLSSR